VPSSSSETSKIGEVTGEACGVTSGVALELPPIMNEDLGLRRPHLPPEEEVGLLARPLEL